MNGVLEENKIFVFLSKLMLTSSFILLLVLVSLHHGLLPCTMHSHGSGISQERLDYASPHLSGFNNEVLFLAHTVCPLRVGWALLHDFSLWDPSKGGPNIIILTVTAKGNQEMKNCPMAF